MTDWLQALTDPLGNMTGLTVNPTGNPISTAIPSASSAKPTNPSSASSSDDGFLPNVLNKHQQVAYHFRLMMLTESANFGRASASELQSGLSKAGTVVIAESGVTGYNIKDVHIRSTVTATAEGRSTNANEFEITVIEPMGTSFLDSIVLAARKLGIQNWSKFDYFLELTFKAYDESGAIATNPCADLGAPNGGRWLWRISINTMDVSLDASGAVYKMRATATSDIAKAPQSNLTQELLSITSDTVGDFFQQFGSQLTSQSQTRDGLDSYEFIIHPIPNGPDPKTFKITPQNRDMNNFRNMSLKTDDKGKMVIHIPKGTAVNDVIDYIFANCEEAAKLARADAQSPASGNPDRTVFRVYNDTSKGNFDLQYNDYKRKHKIYVQYFPTQRVFLSPDEQKKVSGTQVISDLKKKGRLAKRYDYIFTGLNTEVINFDIRYSLAWSAVVTKFKGYNFRFEQVEQHAKFNPSVDAAKNQLLQQAANRLSGAQTQTAQASQVLASGRDPITGQALSPEQRRLYELAQQGGFRNAEAIESSIRDLAQSPADLAAVMNAVRSQQNSMASAKAAEGSVSYAEDLLGGSTTLQVSTAETDGDPRHAIGSGLSGSYEPGKSVYGAILEQLYDQANLSRITLEIRGDPYWLGYSNIEMSAMLAAGPGNPTIKMPDWREGDMSFLLHFKYPYRIGDDGTPIVRSADAFNGVYIVTHVDHVFQNGEYRITLAANRNLNVDPNSATAAATKNTVGSPTEI